jgi:signal transduction histidine kinase
VDVSQAVVEGLRIVVYGGLAVVAVRAWRQGRDVAGAWLAATFGILGAVVVVSDRLPEHSDAFAVDAARRFVLAGLLLFPYLLHRFAASFDERRGRVDHLVGILTVAVVGVGLLGPRLPEEGEPEPAWLGVYVLAVTVQWTAASFTAAARLWRAGTGQPTVTRSRMQLMALGSIVLNAALLVLAAGSSSSSSTQQGLEVASQVLGFVSAGLFFVGFDPPAFLRYLWRRNDIIPLREAQEALMRAVSAREVADVVLPYAARVLGAKGAALVDRDGQVVAAFELAADEVAAAASLAANETSTEPVHRGDVIAMPMRRSWLVVKSSRYTPFFGRDEIELLRGLAVFAGLALDRAELFEQERASRERAEAANADLETFVYSVSHDLKSPLVSLVGFLDYLRTDLGEVDGDVAFFLDRMDASVQYMDALIHDLLELSRIGRVDQEAAEVDLGRVVTEVVDDRVPGHAGAEVDGGVLPIVTMNPLRARQLFTNLLGNAVAHAGRSDVHVQVRAEPLPDGGARVVVVDDGKGIPAEYREKVFGVFERLERNRESTGTGIGLAVCRKVVEQVGGSIRVADSETGAVLEVELPAAVVCGFGARLEEAR